MAAYRASFILAPMLLVFLSAASLAADIWYEDNNLGRGGGLPADFVEKFRRPETFQEASRHIHVYLMRVNVLQQMDDAFFTALLFPYLKKNNIKLALNSGGATWAQVNQRRRNVSEAHIDMLTRLKRLGGQVDYISLQSILSKPWRGGRDGDTVSDYPLEKRIEDAVNFARAARAVYPEVAIGIIDALPSKGMSYKRPYRLLKDALAREGIGLAYVHLDVPFDIPKTKRNNVTWSSIREIERYVEDDLGVAFGLFATSRAGGHTSSEEWHLRTMGSLDCYAGAGGTPREYIVASWFPHPQKTIPETATGSDYPTMRTVLEFGRRLEQIQKNNATWVKERAGDLKWKSWCGIAG